jgi:hypothetical protein
MCLFAPLGPVSWRYSLPSPSVRSTNGPDWACEPLSPEMWNW